MRIKTLLSTTKARRIAQCLLVLAVLSIFGYMGYKDLFFDKAASAESHIVAQGKSIQESISKLPADAKKPQAYYGQKRAEIALAEYHKNVIETKHGCNCGPEIDKYTQSTHAQWCTMFASWVTNEAGSPMYDEKTKSWRIANSRDFMYNLQKNGTWHSREEIKAKGLKPKLGDYMVFWRGNFDDNLGHVDVVIDLDQGNGHAGLLGGNLKDKVDYRDFPYLEFYGFLGYGHPEKEE